MCSVARHEPRAQRDSCAARVDRTAAQPAEARLALQPAQRSAHLAGQLHTARGVQHREQPDLRSAGVRVAVHSYSSCRALLEPLCVLCRTRCSRT